MKFHRSPAGLSNLHLFVSADVVIFIEGGQQSFTMDEVLNGRYSASSVDLKFWQGMFSIFICDGRKFQFRAIGSKLTLRSIANFIFYKKITNVWVAMDRDHDCFHGELQIAPGILYTYGYSWENDVCIAEVIEDVFWALVQIARGTIPIRNEIEDLFTKIYGDLRKAVYLDILMSFYNGSLLPRDKPHSICLLSGVYKKPSVNRELISRLISQLRKNYPRPILRKTAIDMQVARDCAGCILACFYYRILLFLTKKHAKLGKNEKHIIDNLMIEKFTAYIDQYRRGNTFSHYAGQFAMLDNRVENLVHGFSGTKGRLQRFLSLLRNLVSG